MVDTQVWVSGLLNPRGAAAKVIGAFEAGLFALAISEPVFGEYERVLRSFAPVLGDDVVDAVLLAMLEVASVTDAPELPLICRDPGDNKFLECAVASSASLLVTKNTKHFPARFGQVRVVRISEFLRALGL